MTPVINQVVELDKRRGKSNRIKKFILLRISGCILGWGQDLLYKSMTAFVKSMSIDFTKPMSMIRIIDRLGVIALASICPLHTCSLQLA